MTVICSNCHLPRNARNVITRYGDDGKPDGFTCKVCIKKFIKQGKLHVPKADGNRTGTDDNKSPVNV